MIKNKRLSRHIADASWGMFVEFLTYKAKWYDRNLVKIDTFFPSSKLCNICKNKNDELRLSDRKWQCKSCLALHDRDHNAAINIKNESLNMIAKKKDLKEIKSMLERIDYKHCGEVISVGSQSNLTSVKQEAHSIA